MPTDAADHERTTSTLRNGTKPPNGVKIVDLFIAKVTFKNGNVLELPATRTQVLRMVRRQLRGEGSREVCRELVRGRAPSHWRHIAIEGDRGMRVSLDLSDWATPRRRGAR